MELRMVESELDELEHRYSLNSTPSRSRTDLVPHLKPVRRMSNKELEARIREEQPTTPEERPVRRPSPIRYEELGRPDPRAFLSPTALPPRTPNPAFSDSKEASSSKAYTLAMKALQDRIQTLETDNLHLQETLSVQESKGYQDRSRLQQRHLQDLEEGKAKETALAKKLEELQDAYHAQSRQVAKLEDDCRAAEGRGRGQEDESRKAHSRLQEELEQRTAQVEHLRKQLDSKGSEVQTVQQLLAKSEADSRVLLEQFERSQELVANLQGELEFLRTNGQAQRHTLQKNLSHVETELGKQNADYLQRMRQLEVKNKHLTDLAESQKSQLDYLKQEVLELQRMNRQSEEARLAMLQGKGVSRPESVDLGEQEKKHRTQRGKRPDSVHRSKRSSPPPRESEESEETTEERLEREIVAYNRQYKSLLHKSQEPGADLASLRVELNSVAAAMEAKSNHLYSLKKQRSFTREKPLHI